MLMMCALLVLGACTGGDAMQTASADAAGCVDDSKHCISRRQASLQSMLADPARTWVRSPTTPASAATGVKLFAYRQTKEQLSCSQLDYGRDDTRRMPGMLSSTAVPGANESRIAQVKDMAKQVHRELDNEFKRVCQSPTQARKGFEKRAG
jgi:hypothetical protein